MTSYNGNELIQKLKDVFDQIDDMKIFMRPMSKDTFKMQRHSGYIGTKREILMNLGLSKDEFQEYIKKGFDRTDKEQRAEIRKLIAEEQKNERQLYEKLKLKYEDIKDNTKYKVIGDKNERNKTKSV